VITVLLQFAVLLLVLAYRRWYLKEGVVDIRYDVDILEERQ
jgi:hypothetical protein